MTQAPYPKTNLSSITGLCLLLAGIACNGGGERLEDSPQPSIARIVNGTREPQNTWLSDGEQLAVGFLADPNGEPFCTGTLVAPRIVATASHCLRRVSSSRVYFGMGTLPETRQAFLPVHKIERHPSIDFAILILGLDAMVELPSVRPIALNREAMSASWTDRWVDASGYGRTNDINRVGRYFASVQLFDYDAETVQVDGHGQQGICFGDSGGPILWQASAGVGPVVVGTEQWGDETCVDVDHLTRVDVVATWVDDIVNAGLPPLMETCGDVSYSGECRGNVLYWCGGDYLRVVDCDASGSTCAYAGASTGFNCLAATCDDVDYFGRCIADLLQWCDGGTVRSSDCSRQELQCGWESDTVGNNCCPACDGQCVDVTTSTLHCGGCGQACAPAHGTGSCVAGACEIIACDTGFVDADDLIDNGCEVDTNPAKKEKLKGGGGTFRGCQSTKGPFSAALALIALGMISIRRRGLLFRKRRC